MHVYYILCSIKSFRQAFPACVCVCASWKMVQQLLTRRRHIVAIAAASEFCKTNTAKPQNEQIILMKLKFSAFPLSPSTKLIAHSHVETDCYVKLGWNESERKECTWIGPKSLLHHAKHKIEYFFVLLRESEGVGEQEWEKNHWTI